MDTINIELSDDEIEGLLKKNNVQLRQIMFNKDYAENELKWQSKEDNIKVDGFGRYNYDAVYPDDLRITGKSDWVLAMTSMMAEGRSWQWKTSGQKLKGWKKSMSIP